MGDLILRSLFEAAGSPLDQTLSNGLTFRREEQTISGSRLDLVGENDWLVIGVENKLFHHAADNPWEDYCAHAESLARSPKKAHFLLLSLRPERPPARNRSVEIKDVTYDRFLKCVSRNIGDRILRIEPRYLSYLLDFMATIDNLARDLRIEDSLKQLLQTKDRNYEPTVLDFFRSIRDLQEKLRAKTKGIQKYVGTPPDPFRSSSLWGSLDKGSDEKQIYDSVLYEVKADERHFVLQVWLGLDNWTIEAWSKRNDHDKFVLWLREIGLGEHLRSNSPDDAAFKLPKSRIRLS